MKRRGRAERVVLWLSTVLVLAAVGASLMEVDGTIVMLLVASALIALVVDAVFFVVGLRSDT
ncbi:hypothetical protein OJ998_10120 [Solirubrobacter taibaiensis]|nr:hypothetical protein [Solirubrobacter taibaiensis]